jgi:cytochrome b subunit of formate dehydrogenase
LSAQPAVSYAQSVHGRAVATGSTKAAVCTDCHDSHAVRPANDPQSGIFKFNVARTCSKCHAAIAAQYGEGIHGKALAHGNWSAPVCTDCHGIHTIARTSDRVRGPRASCVHCHEGVRLTQEFAVPANRVATYNASYHGLAKQMGSPVAADCASCHGAHEIRPSSDRKSAINSVNLDKTCGKCHPGASEKFTQGKIHVTNGDVSEFSTTLNTWIRRLYILLIVATIGFMIGHNLLIWFRKVQAARRRPDRVVVRMNFNQRVQHLLVFASFTTLVISGFALAWPESLLGRMFLTEESRRIVHRGAAVVLIAVGLYHLAYLLFTKEGRQLFRDLWIRVKDGRDLAGVLKYYIGLTKEKPEFGRFNYAEKMEYWAGMWGTLVMAITGLVLWYAVGVAKWIPRWWVDIATTIHFYEAILATLAILVWHFYQVIFDPDVYPMNLAWFDGKMSKEQFHEEHGLVTPKPEEQPS